MCRGGPLADYGVAGASGTQGALRAGSGGERERTSAMMTRIVAWGRVMAVVHPFPSILNAVLVVGLFTLARGPLLGALVLGSGMLCLQFAIGAINDVVDAAGDAATKPIKPITSGHLAPRTALLIGVGAASVGLAVYAAWGPLVFLLGAAGLGCGLAYDLGLKRAGLGWLCWAVAFPILPLSTWLAAAGALPPHPELLLPLAAIAGPMLQLANGLVDLERDAELGIPAPVIRLGRRRSLAVLGILVAAVYGATWVSLVGARVPAESLAVIAAGSVIAVAGIRLSAESRPSLRERGWQAQAIALALLAAGWVTAVR